MPDSILIVVYLAAFVAANLLVKKFGPYGLWFSSFTLIPFDLVCRCVFHEKWKGKQLLLRISFITLASSLITILINYSALNIAFASAAGFTAAQITAGIFYQINIRQKTFVKVNGSDIVAIIFDSIVFQYVAFNSFEIDITIGQIFIKFAGGLIWYFIIFKNRK